MISSDVATIIGCAMTVVGVGSFLGALVHGDKSSTPARMTLDSGTIVTMGPAAEEPPDMVQDLGYHLFLINGHLYEENWRLATKFHLDDACPKCEERVSTESR